MPRRTNEQITSVRYYDCGYCVNELSIVYRKHRREKRVFPAGVFLIKHPTRGYVLFDTGYSQSIYKNGFRGWLYRTFNPTHVTRHDEIATQLQKDGISTDDIRYVILSHLHPDHIGGVRFFPKSTIVITDGSYHTYKRPHWNDVLFRKLLPIWFEKKLHVLRKGDQQEFQDGLYGYDLFNDGSILLVELEGHTHGHLGAYIPNKLLLAGDACWGGDLMEYSKHLRLAARLVQDDYKKFKKSLNQLEALQGKGIRLYFSHDQYSERELL